MVTPPSQKHREISFDLRGGGAAAVHHPLIIRPEELTRQEPSRLSVQQTVGGAWADAHGRGIGTITLGGHCGWRGGTILSGEAAFLALRDTVFQAWHGRREAAAAAGSDPAAVELWFTDTLDSITALVAPSQFQLQRKKTSPLLMRYQITLTVLGDTPVTVGSDPIVSALTSATQWIAAVDGLATAIRRISAAVADAIAVVGGIVGAAARLAASLAAVTGLVTALVDAVVGAVRAVSGLIDGATAALIAVAGELAAAARTAWLLLAGQPLPAAERSAMMAMAGWFGDVHCVLATSFASPWGNRGGRFPDYGPLYGASNCSSTSGGRPWSRFTAAGTSPFESLLPAETPPLLPSAEARAAIALLRRDPLTLDLDLAAAGLEAIAAGVSLP